MVRLSPRWAASSRSAGRRVPSASRPSSTSSRMRSASAAYAGPVPEVRQFWMSVPSARAESEVTGATLPDWHPSRSPIPMAWATSTTALPTTCPSHMRSIARGSSVSGYTRSIAHRRRRSAARPASSARRWFGRWMRRSMRSPADARPNAEGDGVEDPREGAADHDDTASRGEDPSIVARGAVQLEIQDDVVAPAASVYPRCGSRSRGRRRARA